MINSDAPAKGPWFGLSLPANPPFPKASMFSAVIAAMISFALSVGSSRLERLERPPDIYPMPVDNFEMTIGIIHVQTKCKRPEYHSEDSSSNNSLW